MTPNQDQTEVEEHIKAARNMDWMQVVLNGGPPCFHLEENGRFCGRAQRWHNKLSEELFHGFVSLEAAILAAKERGRQSANCDNVRLLVLATNKIREAASVFRKYEKMHYEKVTPEGNQKARANGQLALELEQFLGLPQISDLPKETP